MNGPNMMNSPIVTIPAANGPLIKGPVVNGPVVNGPGVNGRVVNGAVRVGREYTGKHRRDSGLGPFSPWSRAEPDGSGPRPEGRSRADAG
jgi:hypothetical protein